MKQQVLNRLIDHMDNKSINFDYYLGCSEPGYEDIQVIAADWNYHERIASFIERYFDGIVSLEWSDEWTSCSECNKAVRTSPTSYGWERSYLWTSDCSIACIECYPDVIDDIIETYKNETNKAVTSDFYQYMEQAGFVCYSPDEYCKVFETGWHHGQNDNPSDVAKDIESNLSGYDYMFKIDSIGQFDVHWSVFIKKQ